jgi:hypothetical protein
VEEGGGSVNPGPSCPPSDPVQATLCVEVDEEFGQLVLHLQHLATIENVPCQGHASCDPKRKENEIKTSLAMKFTARALSLY